MAESESVSCSVVSDSLQPHGLQPARRLCPLDSPGKNTGVGCHALLQGIFQTQGRNPHLLHCRQILDRLIHQGSRWGLMHFQMEQRSPRRGGKAFSRDFSSQSGSSWCHQTGHACVLSVAINLGVSGSKGLASPAPFLLPGGGLS